MKDLHLQLDDATHEYLVFEAQRTHRSVQQVAQFAIDLLVHINDQLRTNLAVIVTPNATPVSITGSAALVSTPENLRPALFGIGEDPRTVTYGLYYRPDPPDLRLV